MVKYTDENGKVRELERYPIIDPYSEVFGIARARASELLELGDEVAQRVVYVALEHFSRGATGEPPPHVEDERADEILQAIIREARDNMRRA